MPSVTPESDASAQSAGSQSDPCTLVLEISVEADKVARTFESVYREFSRYVNVPGFRPGKAPRALVERYVNREKVRERALEKIVQESFRAALQEQGITPYGNPEIQPGDIEDRHPFTYRAIVPLEPQVTLGEYTGLTVEKPVFPVTDAMVEERIQRLRESKARLERVTDRGVEPGDVLIAESQAVVEGDPDPPPMRRQLIQLGNNIPGFDEALLGMQIGEERTFTLTYPQDYDEPDKRGKQVTFTVRLSSISARRLPELDASFAREVAGVDTVDALRQAIRDRLETEVRQLSDQIAEQRLIQQILAGSTVHFPAMMVREEVRSRFRQLQNDLRQRGLTYEQYLAQEGLTPEQHEAELARQAAARIEALLALREISIQEGLQPTEEQIDAEFERLRQENVITEEQHAEYRIDRNRRLQLANAMIQQRLHDFLFANNTIKEVLQEVPPAPEELAEANTEEEQTA
ncbi:MAG: trigger factor [Chloroherpetonaceae bacterium]|nr:trigger factor [Chthonomonadaceae bacterium]MDW8206220.1 trigger factor [Chloroherpetonaceae bacterium]